MLLERVPFGAHHGVVLSGSLLPGTALKRASGTPVSGTSNWSRLPESTNLICAGVVVRELSLTFTPGGLCSARKLDELKSKTYS